MLDLNIDLPSNLSGLTTAGLFMFLFFGTFVSEDAACLLAGTSVATGQASLGLAVTACLAGIFVGDLLLFGIGRVIGTPIFETKFAKRFVSTDNIDRAQAWLTRNAATAVFISRFISGLRLPTYLAAGAFRTGFFRFAMYCLFAAAIWTPILVGTAAYSIDWISPGNTLIVIIFIAIGLRLIFKLTSLKNRRLAVGRVKRILNWEFWPLAVFYFPVVCYVLYLGVRYRRLTLFTAANPGMPAGGFVGESKNGIYHSLDRSAAAQNYCLRYVKIAGADKLTKQLAVAVLFLVKNQLSYPLVLKPDRGERGKGVTIIRDRKRLAEAIMAFADDDLILQEYCDGVEASIFYYRFPTDEKGQIFSVTKKLFPEVIGDGVSTLEELILRDSRAVCMAKSYFKHHADNLARRPADGERVTLIDIGTHSRGAIFRDGDRIKTRELENRVDEICRDVPGFYFGRFDVRAASFDELKQGNFKIIELNGVTSESTNIYDPKFSLFDAYRILFKQWQLAFEIGKANRERGHKPLTLRQFIKLIFTRDASHITDRDSDKLSGVEPTNACA